MARYFLDTEFEEAGPDAPLRLISLAILDETGRGLYHEIEGAKEWVMNPWVRIHVLPHLDGPGFTEPVSLLEMRDLVLAYLGDDPAPEFWGYYCDYDWVVFCQIFGTMDDLPETIPYYCRDLRQALDERGLRDVSQPEIDFHHALADAQWIAGTWRQYFSATPAAPEGEMSADQAKAYRECLAYNEENARRGGTLGPYDFCAKRKRPREVGGWND